MGLGTTLTSAEGHNANYVCGKLASPGVQAPCRRGLQERVRPPPGRVLSCGKGERPIVPAGHVLGVPPTERQKSLREIGSSPVWFCLVLFLVFPFLLYLLAQATQPPPPRPRAESVLYPVHSERLVCTFDVHTQFWGERREHLSPARLPGGPGRASEQRHAGWGWGAGPGSQCRVTPHPAPTPGWERGLLLPGECWDAGRGRAAPPASPKSQVFGAPSPPRLRGRVSQEEPGNSGRPSLSACDLARPRASQGEPLCPERCSKSRPARLLPGAERR